MYLSLNLRNRILHFTIIGLILLSFYTYYYAATNELRQLSVINSASSQSSSGVIRSILSTKREVPGTQTAPKSSTSESSLASNTLLRNANGPSSSNVARNADNSINVSDINLTNNASNRNGASSGNGNGGVNDANNDNDANDKVNNANSVDNGDKENEAAIKENDVINAGNDENNPAEKKIDPNNANKKDDANNANDANDKGDRTNNRIDANDASNKKEGNDANEATNEKNNANDVPPKSTVLTSQPLVPPSLAKSNEQTAVVEAEKKQTEEIKVVQKKVKPDSAGAFYVPGHSVPIPEKCYEHGANVSLLILIASAPANFEARMAIRHTWGHFDQRNDVSIAFLLGETSDLKINDSLKQEQNMYGDVIHGRFIDSYSNLTLKTISALEWVTNYCPKVKFVLKTDDDMFINVPRLLSFVRSHSKDKNVIFGRLARRWKPIRNVKSKYYVSPQQFKPATFPDFTTGPAYLFSSDVAPKLYAEALEQTYLKLEDVFTTGIVAHYLNIKRIQANEFLNKRIAFSPCNIQKSISIHMVKYSEQFDLWKKLLDGKSKCK